MNHVLAKQQPKPVFFFNILVTKNNLWSQWVATSDKISHS